jgi:hypothetical protein
MVKSFILATNVSLPPLKGALKGALAVSGLAVQDQALSLTLNARHLADLFKSRRPVRELRYIPWQTLGAFMAADL